MKDAHQTLIKEWTIRRAAILAVVCLTAGIAGGWSIRGSQSLSLTRSTKAATVLAPARRGVTPATEMPGSVRLKEMADAQAAPLLNKLKSDPNNPDLLTQVGNLYYDAQQYPISVEYYGRALEGKPADVAVRTDMGTAYWYMERADAAIVEFDKALIFAPNNPNTLFNLGLVRWKGKKDSAGAVAAWKKLLAANPNYEGKEKVKEMMAEAGNQAAAKPGMPGK